MALNRPRSLQLYDPVLTGLARSYRPHGLIARQIIPSMPVSQLSGQYPVFDKQSWFQVQADNRISDRAPAKEVDWKFSTEAYLVDEYALKVGWTDLEAQQADAALRFQQTKQEFLTAQMELAHELRVASLLLPASLGGQLSSSLTHTPSNAWDTADGDPEADFKTASLACYRATGLRPTHIVLDYEVAYALAVNGKFRTLLRYDAAGAPRDFISLGEQVVPRVIHGMQVVIADGAQYDSSREGGTASVGPIWGKHVRLLYNPPGVRWGQPATCYLLQHTAKKVTRWRETDPDLNYIREMERYDIKVTADETAYVIQSVIS